MPAIKKFDLKKAFKDALLSRGFVDNQVVDKDEQGNPIPKTIKEKKNKDGTSNLPNNLDKIIDALAEGLEKAWIDWQSKQKVTIPVGTILTGTTVGIVPGAITITLTTPTEFPLPPNSPPGALVPLT